MTMESQAQLRSDPGLQPQRTALAWLRTAFAAFVVAVLALRIAIIRHDPALFALSLLTSAGAVGMYLRALWRPRQTTAIHSTCNPATRNIHAATAAMTVVAALLELVRLFG